MNKETWFDTLREALQSEGLEDLWTMGLNVSYDENVRILTDCGRLISVFRNNNGRYERPVHYSTL
jgi:hypothetical protein